MWRWEELRVKGVEFVPGCVLEELGFRGVIWGALVEIASEKSFSWFYPRFQDFSLQRRVGGAHKGVGGACPRIEGDPGTVGGTMKSGRCLCKSGRGLERNGSLCKEGVRLKNTQWDRGYLE